MAEMFGFIKNSSGNAVISNRIFETVLYNLFLSEEALSSKIYKAALQEKNHFIQNGHLNGTGNYYIEAQTRNMERTDVIIDYNGEQFIVELKLWRGNAYKERGEAQLLGYLNHYHLKKGYMVSFNFNKKKQIGVRKITFGEKTLIEAMV